mgnify:CR=1 FL=1|jgi:hypothetical protein
MKPLRMTKTGGLGLLCVFGLWACGSQNDPVGVGDIGGNQILRGGIFETVVSGSEPESDWTFMFAEGPSARNPDRVIAYAEDGSAFLTGRFTAASTGGTTRRASVLWFDQVLVTPEPDPDADPEDPPPEPELQRRVRNAVLEIDIDPGEAFVGQVVGSGVNVNLVASYAQRRYERISNVGLLAGIWENLDPFGGETLSLDFNDQGGFGGRDIEDCTYSGQAFEINRRYNLYAFEIASACNEAVDATGLATIVPPPLNAPAGARETLMAIAPARDNTDVYVLKVSRALD